MEFVVGIFYFGSVDGSNLYPFNLACLKVRELNLDSYTSNKRRLVNDSVVGRF